MNANIAGRIAKYLATSLAIENVVSAPRVISSCLPTSTISISFVGFESRSTMFPASFAAVVPVFIATPTSAWASAGASFVPSPVIATIRPFALLLLDQRHLRLRRRLGEEVVDAGLLRDHGGGDAVVAGDHHGADAHPAQLVEALVHAALDDVLQVDDAERPVVPRDDERRAALLGDALHDPVELRRRAAALLGDEPLDGVGGALADQRAVQVDAAHPRLRAERDELVLAELALAQAEPLLREHDDRAAFRRLVGERGELRDLGQLALVDARRPAGTRRPAGCRA